MKLAPTRVEFDTFIGKWIFLICFATLVVGGLCALIVVVA